LEPSFKKRKTETVSRWTKIKINPENSAEYVEGPRAMEIIYSDSSLQMCIGGV